MTVITRSRKPTGHDDASSYVHPKLRAYNKDPEQKKMKKQAPHRTPQYAYKPPASWVETILPWILLVRVGAAVIYICQHIGSPTLTIPSPLKRQPWTPEQQEYHRRMEDTYAAEVAWREASAAHNRATNTEEYNRRMKEAKAAMNHYFKLKGENPGYYSYCHAGGSICTPSRGVGPCARREKAGTKKSQQE
jgi:hypothetical protein